MRRVDCRIGYRAAEEMEKRYGYESVSRKFQKETRCSHHAYSNWRNGNCPDAHSLKLMAEVGFDVIYILTGKRTQEEEKNDC